jgi:hypothetical protein
MQQVNLCKFILTPKGCAKGSACCAAHPIPGHLEICRAEYAQKGSQSLAVCAFGEKCRDKTACRGLHCLTTQPTGLVSPPGGVKPSHAGDNAVHGGRARGSDHATDNKAIRFACKNEPLAVSHWLAGDNAVHGGRARGGGRGGRGGRGGGSGRGDGARRADEHKVFEELRHTHGKVGHILKALGTFQECVKLTGDEALGKKVADGFRAIDDAAAQVEAINKSLDEVIAQFKMSVTEASGDDDDATDEE